MHFFLTDASSSLLLPAAPPTLETSHETFHAPRIRPLFFFKSPGKFFPLNGRPLPRRRLGEASAGRQVVCGRQAESESERQEHVEGRRLYVGPVWTVEASLCTSTRDPTLLQHLLLPCVNPFASVPPSPRPYRRAPSHVYTFCCPCSIHRSTRISRRHTEFVTRTFPAVPTFFTPV